MPHSAADLVMLKALPPDSVAKSVANCCNAMKTLKAIVLPNPRVYYKSVSPVLHTNVLSSANLYLRSTVDKAVLIYHQ